MTDKQTALQTALIDAGLNTFQFHNDGVDYPVKVTDLPDASLVRIARYGKRVLNDVVNSTASRSDKTKATICKEYIAKLVNGEVGSGGGRARISTLERALRNVVGTYLVAAGVSNKDAAQLCKEPEKGFRLYLTKRGLKGDKLEAAFTKHWSTVQAKARAFVALEDFDLD